MKSMNAETPCPGKMKKPSRITDPKHWVVIIIWGSTEQSRKNWIKSFLELPRASVARDCTIGWLVLCHKVVDSFLSCAYPPQSTSMCSIVYGICSSWQLGDRQYPSLFLLQCLQRYSVQYLPDSSLACWIALVTLYGFPLAVVHRGWRVFKLISWGEK